MRIWLQTFTLVITCAALGACGGNSGRPSPGSQFDNTYAYTAGSPVGATALQCAKEESPRRSCPLVALAPIAFYDPAAVPSVEQIMERVLVSHDWMGQRFEQLLRRMPEDIHYLLGGVTAIVIDDDIRPSYYTNVTGAIYLDPARLWLTRDERAVINAEPDYRAAYAGAMNFRALWRYILPGADYATTEDEPDERTLEDIEPYLAALLFHELAHANDILPRSTYAGLDTSQSFFSATQARSEAGGADDLSKTLSADFPLQSAMMKRIADILYLGHSPTTGERQLTALEVGQAFAGDSANDEYAYTSEFEDLAMLFEESMMKIHYGAERDVVYANLPAVAADNPQCDQFTVGWGMRNRLGEPAVAERAQWVVDQLLPHIDYSMAFATLAAPRMIPAGLGWCQSARFEDIQPMLYYKSGYRPASPRPFDPRDAMRPYELRMH